MPPGHAAKRARVRNMSDDRYSKHGKLSNQAERPRVPVMSRRDVVARGAIALGSVLAGGYLMKQGLGTASAAEMLKIGVPLEMTGPIAEEAEEMVHGWELYLKQHGNQLGGAPVKLFTDDIQATPSMAIAKARQEIESDFVGLHRRNGARARRLCDHRGRGAEENRLHDLDRGVRRSDAAQAGSDLRARQHDEQPAKPLSRSMGLPEI